MEHQGRRDNSLGNHENGQQPLERMEDVRWLVNTAREEFPGVFDDLDEFMKPARTNYHALRASYGPYHGDDLQMVKFILLDYHGLTRDEIEQALVDSTSTVPTSGPATLLTR